MKMNLTIPINPNQGLVEYFIKIERTMTISIQSFGLVNNLLMLAVYSQGNLRKVSVSVYFRFMAISCLCQNVFFLLNIELNRHIKGSPFLLDLMNYFYMLFSPISAWFEVAAGLDRFLTLLIPFKFNLIRGKLFQHIVGASIVSFNCFFYLYIFFDSRSVSV